MVEYSLCYVDWMVEQHLWIKINYYKYAGIEEDHRRCLSLTLETLSIKYKTILLMLKQCK